MTDYEAPGRIWSQSDRGHMVHAYPALEGSALCRRNLPARRWFPDWKPAFRAAGEALLPACPKCTAALHAEAPANSVADGRGGWVASGSHGPAGRQA